MLNESNDVASEPPLEAYRVNSKGGDYFVIDGLVAGVIDERCLHSTTTLFGGAFAALGRQLWWAPAVYGLADNLARLSVQYGMPEHEVLQQLIDRGCLGPHHGWSLHTLGAKLLAPHVSPTLIGDNIKREREARGWTVEELADRSNLDPLEVEAYEDGSLIIFPEQLVQLAGVLGLENPERLLEAA